MRIPQGILSTVIACFRPESCSNSFSDSYRRPHAMLNSEFISKTIIRIAMPGEHNYRISVGPAAAATTSPSISRAPLSSGLPSQSLTHQDGGSIGRCPSCSPGQTSAKKYQTCPTTTPSISSFGIDPCMHKLKAIRTHGSHGAVKTNIPRKLSRVSGLRRDQM
jgi:hypothetical protein